ncbi:MAG: efflux transporter outer membrane subunit [Bryobacteraceae bacterium]
MRARILAALALTLAGCTLGPNYKRPTVAAPPTFRGQQTPETEPSLADSKWFDLFQDEQLKSLVKTALEHNFDVAIAAERVEQARQQYGIARANEFPFLSAQAGLTTQRQSSVGSFRFIQKGTDLSATYTQAGAAVTWDVDLFGRLRRLRESARARYLATEETKHGVTVALIGDVMTSYFLLRERDLELQIARQTRDVANDSVRLVNLRHDRGVATGLDVHQAEQLLYTATSQIASTDKDIRQTEDALNLLLGQAPGDIARGNKLEEFKMPPQLAAGLPSSLLERRPDIRAAEQNLISANAQIGAAKAMYFPDISLTGFLGGQSRQLTNLFTGPARFWTITPSGTLPIFNAGQVRANVRLTEAQQRELLVTYQKTIYGAFRDVSDALAAYQYSGEQLTEQQKLVTALSESTRLSELRYKGGLDSYLQVLDSQRNLFRGQLTLAQLRLQVMTSYVQLYRSLGGGWQ